MAEREGGRRKGRASRIAVWIILALLVVGLIGFGTDNFGGAARSVASVGEEEISAEAYGRALEAELRQIQAATGAPITVAQMREEGLDQAVLGRLPGPGRARRGGPPSGDLGGRRAGARRAGGDARVPGPHGRLRRGGLTASRWSARA